MIEKLSIKEKIGFAQGDGAANIAWRGVSPFLYPLDKTKMDIITSDLNVKRKTQLTD